MKVTQREIEGDLSLIRKFCFYESHHCATPKAAVCTRTPGAASEWDLAGAAGHAGEIPLPSASLLLSNTFLLFNLVNGGQRGERLWNNRI